MSPQEPAPQPDDQTPVKPWGIPFEELTEGQVITVEVKGSAKRYRVKSVTHEGNTWTASVVPADLDDLEAVYWPVSAEPTTEPKFNATVLSETAATAAERRIMAGQVTTFSKTIHRSPEGWSHVAGTDPDERRAFLGPYTSLSGMDQPDLVELTAQWLGERESTHLWPEIHESDKACYRDAARHLVTTVKFGLVAQGVSLNPEERKVAADALEAMGPSAASAARIGMEIANRTVKYASLDASAAAAMALEFLGKRDDVVAVQLPEPLRERVWPVVIGGETEAVWVCPERDVEYPIVVSGACSVDATEARNLAAALLAAAAKAEAGE